MKDNFTKEVADRLIDHYRVAIKAIEGKEKIQEVVWEICERHVQHSIEHCCLRVMGISIYNSERVTMSFGSQGFKGGNVLEGLDVDVARERLKKAERTLVEIRDYYWGKMPTCSEGEE